MHISDDEVSEHMYTSVCTHTHTRRESVGLPSDLLMCTCMQTHTHTCMIVCMYVYMYIDAQVCMLIYPHTHINNRLGKKKLDVGAGSSPGQLQAGQQHAHTDSMQTDDSTQLQQGETHTYARQ